MLFPTFVAALAVLGSANAAPAKSSQTCSAVPANNAKAKLCSGITGDFKNPGATSKTLISTSAAANLTICASACKGDFRCKSFGYDTTSGACQLYQNNLQNLKLQANGGNTSITYYDASCYTRKCVDASAPPCVCTSTSISTFTSYIATKTAFTTAIDVITADTPTATTTSYSYTVEDDGYISYSISTVFLTRPSTLTFPTTIVETSTSTETDAFSVTETPTETATSTSYVYNTINTVNFAAQKKCTCASPISTDTVYSTMTVFAQATAAGTTTVQSTFTPEAVTSTSVVLATVTQSVVTETQIAYHPTTVISTITELSSITTTEVPIATLNLTLSFTSTATTTTGVVAATNVAVCPESDRAYYTVYEKGQPDNFQIGCSQVVGGMSLTDYSFANADFTSCIRRCANNYAGIVDASGAPAGYCAAGVSYYGGDCYFFTYVDTLTTNSISGYAVALRGGLGG